MIKEKVFEDEKTVKEEVFEDEKVIKDFVFEDEKVIKENMFDDKKVIKEVFEENKNDNKFQGGEITRKKDKKKFKTKILNTKITNNNTQKKIVKKNSETISKIYFLGPKGLTVSAEDWSPPQELERKAAIFLIAFNANFVVSICVVYLQGENFPYLTI